MLSLTVGDYRLDITNDPPYFDGSADNLCSYDRLHSLDADAATATSSHALRLFRNDQQIRSCLISAGGGASGVHENTALIHDCNCIIAVGPFMASVALPSLELNWATQTDDATCFGVYESPNHNCLLSHGELLIARVTHRGTIVWKTGGADIFTNGFRLDRDVIHVADFYDRNYILDIETGREIAA
jgi:hypothetical protein